MIISRPSAEDMIALTEGKSAKALQCITTTLKRAETLLAEGYKIAPTTRSLVYEVQKPPQILKRTGELREFPPYIVDAAAGTCSCPMFAGYRTCKHSLAVVTAVSEAMALLVPASVPEETPVTCVLCDGVGERAKWERCTTCEGRAEVQIVTGEDRSGYPVWGWEWCSACSGRGGGDVWRQCGHCEGAGTVIYAGGQHNV